MTINPSGKLIYPEKLSTLDAERAYDAESGRNVILVAAEAVIAREDETAQLPVPNNDPVIPLYTDSVSNLYIKFDNKRVSYKYHTLVEVTRLPFVAKLFNTNGDPIFDLPLTLNSLGGGSYSNSGCGNSK